MQDLINENFIQIDYFRLLLGSLLLIIQILLISSLYKSYSSSYNNKNKFSKNLIPFGISILIIVTVIKSSLALSLGLIGALSIIRFRTAIKDPEEIIILLMIMGCAVSIAAERELVGVLLIIVYLISYFLINKQNMTNSSSSYDVSIIVDLNKSQKLNDLIFNEFNSKLVFFSKGSGESLNLLYKVYDKKNLKSIIAYFDQLQVKYTIETSLNED
tara:strand:- start:133 stop:777 length:645 start_codon:yes stop_codon:yes gene_type:complete